MDEVTVTQESGMVLYAQVYCEFKRVEKSDFLSVWFYMHRCTARIGIPLESAIVAYGSICTGVL